VTGADSDDVRAAFDVWAAGTRYTHEHFCVDPTQFVGRIPAEEFRRAEAELLAALPSLFDKLKWLQDEREAVIACVNIYGDEMVHRALHDIGFASRSTPTTLHRYDYALSLDRVSAACACEGYWPCDMEGHRTYDIRDYDGEFRCVPDCQHPSHASEVGDWTEGP
jgi:hypothetical protein